MGKIGQKTRQGITVDDGKRGMDHDPEILQVEPLLRRDRPQRFHSLDEARTSYSRRFRPLDPVPVHGPGSKRE